MQNVKFTLGQEVYREGGPCDKVFFTTTGQFEVSKETLLHSPPAKFSPEALKKDKHYCVQRPPSVQRSQISIVGSNEMIGLEEYFSSKEKRMCSIRCVSTEGRAMQVSKDDLFRIIKGEHARERLREFVQSKLDFMAQRLSSVKNSMRNFRRDEVESSPQPPRSPAPPSPEEQIFVYPLDDRKPNDD